MEGVRFQTLTWPATEKSSRWRREGGGVLKGFAKEGWGITIWELEYAANITCILTTEASQLGKHSGPRHGLMSERERRRQRDENVTESQLADEPHVLISKAGDRSSRCGSKHLKTHPTRTYS